MFPSFQWKGKSPQPPQRTPGHRPSHHAAHENRLLQPHRTAPQPAGDLELGDLQRLREERHRQQEIDANLEANRHTIPGSTVVPREGFVVHLPAWLKSGEGPPILLSRSSSMQQAGSEVPSPDPQRLLASAPVSPPTAGAPALLAVPPALSAGPASSTLSRRRSFTPLDAQVKSQLVAKLKLTQEQSQNLPDEFDLLGTYLEGLAPESHVRVEYDLVDGHLPPAPDLHEEEDGEEDDLGLEPPQGEVQNYGTTKSFPHSEYASSSEEQFLTLPIPATSAAGKKTKRTKTPIWARHLFEEHDQESSPTSEISPVTEREEPAAATADESQEKKPTIPRFKMVVDEYKFEQDSASAFERVMSFGSARKSMHVLRPPRMELDREAEDEEKERSATWLQLIYDIFYVAAIRMLSHTYLLSWSDLLNFIIIFTSLWWSWMVVTLYDTKYDTDDIFHRLLKFLQMAAVGGLAVSAQSALTYTTTSDIFVVSFIMIRLTLLVGYSVVYWYTVRDGTKKNRDNAPDFYVPGRFTETQNTFTRGTGKQFLEPPKTRDRMSVDELSWSQQSNPSLSDEHLRPNASVTRLLILSNVVSIVLWGLCLLFHTYGSLWYRMFFWIASFLVDLAVNLFTTWKRKQAPFRGSHLPERMGLFTIIVLGECAIAVIQESGDGIELFSKVLKLKSNAGNAIASVMSAMMTVTTNTNSSKVFPQTPAAAVGGNSGSLQTIQLFETMFICFLFLVNVFTLWWMYFDDFASHFNNIYRLKNISIFDRMRNLWIYMHLPYHMLLTLSGVTMVDSISRVFVNNISQVAGMAVDFDPNKVKPESTIVAELVSVFALTMFFSGIFKFIHTYNSEDTLIKSTAYTRFGFAGLILLAFIPPMSLYQSNGASGNNLSPIAYLILAITCCTVMQVVIDVMVQHRIVVELHRTYQRTLTRWHTNHGNAPNHDHASGNDMTVAGAAGPLSPGRETLGGGAATTWRKRNSPQQHQLTITRVGEAIPMKD